LKDVLREPSESKIGRAVMTIALVAATALLALAIAWLIGSAVQRHLKGEPIQHREALHQAALSFRLRATQMNRCPSFVRVEAGKSRWLSL
jgi:hypothetical protein